MSERFAITGTGMMTSVGSDPKGCFEAFCSGVSGNRRLQAFDAQKFHAQHAYEIADREGGERPGRASEWLCHAITQALDEAALDCAPDEVVMLVGTGLRELRSFELWWMGRAAMTAEDLHFATVVRQRTGLTGPVWTFSNACAASNFALGLGADLLTLQEARAVVVAGCDSITESMFGLLDRVNPLHPERVQPFDRDRRGVLMGEGAAALVLEPAEAASTRGARVRAWLRGVGMSCDAHHVTAPHRDGIVRAINDAHCRSAVTPEEIDLLMVHGTGTLLNDSTEARAVGDVFGAHVRQMAVTGIKSMTGHTSGASGLVGVLTAIECMQSGRIPPTVGLNSPIDEAADFRFIVGAAERARPHLAQVNAFGFGGVNAVVVLEDATLA